MTHPAPRLPSPQEAPKEEPKVVETTPAEAAATEPSAEPGPAATRGPARALADLGAATVRLDESVPAKYALRTVSGKLRVDGIERSQSGIGSNYAGTTGELSGSFADVRANTVSGDVTVIRRVTAAISDDAPVAEEY